MSKTIQIKSLKKGFKVSKIQVVANENYIIVDESGKTFDKLKFVQKDKDLEIFIEKDGWSYSSLTESSSMGVLKYSAVNSVINYNTIKSKFLKLTAA